MQGVVSGWEGYGKGGLRFVCGEGTASRSRPNKRLRCRMRPGVDSMVVRMSSAASFHHIYDIFHVGLLSALKKHQMSFTIDAKVGNLGSRAYPSLASESNFGFSHQTSSRTAA